MAKMHVHRSEDGDGDIASVPRYGWDEEGDDGFSPPASMIQNSSFSQAADHGHGDSDVEERHRSIVDNGGDTEGQNEVGAGSDGLVQNRFRMSVEVGRSSQRAYKPDTD